jgi:ATP/maltotriose-dependent transcriptional regulator MalT
MHPIPPYGVAVTQAIASGDLDTMRQVAEQAEAHLNQHGDIAQLLRAGCEWKKGMKEAPFC